MQRLKADLAVWYKSEARLGRPRNTVKDLTLSMLGAEGRRELATHGAETNAIVEFAAASFESYSHIFTPRDRKLWKSVLESAVVLLNILRVKTMVLPEMDVQRFVNATLRHLHGLRSLGVHLRPKHHMMLEQAARFGRGENSPRG